MQLEGTEGERAASSRDSNGGSNSFQNEGWVTIIIASRCAAGSDAVIIAGTCWRPHTRPISTGGLGADSQPAVGILARKLHRALPVLGIESILVSAPS